MKPPPVRELLAGYLRQRQATVLRRLLALIKASPDLAEMHEVAQSPEHAQVVGTLLDLLAANIADPNDRRCFHYARQRALARFRQNIQATQMLRMAVLYRQDIVRLVTRRFAAEPLLVRRMTELIETQVSELELAFTEAYQTTRDRQWHISETRYFSLFENASEAIISFLPQEGRIVEVNMQAERLLGRPRAEILGMAFGDLFTDEHRDQIAWLVEQAGGTANLRLEDMRVRRQDGSAVPISLSCNWVMVDGAAGGQPGGQPVAQAIMRDVTQLRQMQHELQSYAEQLEARVEARTGELQASEERFRTLFLQEQRRAQHLSLINDVQRCALATRDMDIFLHRVTNTIQSHFRECDVTFLLCRDETTDTSPDSAAADADVVASNTSDTDSTTKPTVSVAAATAASTSLAEASSRVGSEALAEGVAVAVLTATGDVTAVNEAATVAEGVARQHPGGTDAAGVEREMLNGVAGTDSGSISDGAADSSAATETASPASAGAPGARWAELVVVAQAGGHGLSLPVGARQVAGAGLAGQVAATGQTLVVANDAAHDARDARSEQTTGALRAPGAEMCVPVAVGGEMIGVICVLSARRDVFDPRDATALQTAATIVAAHVQSSRMFQDMRDLKEFNETLVGTMLHSLMVVNREGLIQIVNERLCQTLRLSRDDLLHHEVTRVFSEAARRRHGFDSVLRDVSENGNARELQEVHIWVRSPGQPDLELVFDVRVSRVYFRGAAHVVLLLINLTQRWRKTQQLQLMNEMSRVLQSSLDIHKVLHTVLTCITAGPALGFNRAFLLLLNDDERTLHGAMALGPSSAEEAGRIWHEMGRNELTLQDILADESAFDPARPQPLQKRVASLIVDLGNPCLHALARAVHERRSLRVARDEMSSPDFSAAPPTDSAAPRRDQCAALLELLSAPELAIAPLLSKERIVGVVLADNLYTGAPIEDDDVRMLDTVAQQASLTIDNALTYQALQKAQKELVTAERLVAVGEMAARVSHEIRNPLSTIGGFARSILKRPEDDAGVRRKVGVIVDEVARLEELLGDLLDMARPRELDLQPQAINEIVERALLLADADIKAAGVEVKKQLAPDLPPLLADGRRLLQALLNTIRNGAQAMPDGGLLVVATRAVRQDAASVGLEIEVRDSGVGIAPKALQQVFDPFFSTKIRGSGLGLAVTLRIIRDHGGDINVYSEEGAGTTFIMSLPLRRAALDTQSAPALAAARPDA